MWVGVDAHTYTPYGSNRHDARASSNLDVEYGCFMEVIPRYSDCLTQVPQRRSERTAPGDAQVSDSPTE